jgi:predicted nucleotide-binding protein
MEGCRHPDVDFVPWWDEFTAGRTLLQELTRIGNTIQAAILLVTPEGVATNQQGNQIVVPNLNVIFEFGFFYSLLGHDRVAVVKYGTVNMPSDLGGYIHINGSAFFKAGAGVPVGKRTKKEWDRWLGPVLVPTP